MAESTYTTRKGQMWDEIAAEIYGDEKHADYLMAQNLQLVDIYVFDAGTVLQTPDLPESVDGSLPQWRQ